MAKTMTDIALCFGSRLPSSFQKPETPEWALPSTRGVKSPVDTTNPWGLSVAERDAIKAVMECGTHTAAGEKLGLSFKTIECQIQRARQKMGGVHLIGACLMLDRWERGEQ